MKALEDVIDFANLVFNLKGEGINFEELLPKAYSEERAERLEHHIIEEDGKIRALIDLYPLELRQPGCALKAAYVGTVSVHPNSRGKGYMTELMGRAQASARASGCDLMLLDGGRRRYQHYGFERAGIKHNYNITADSIRHCCQEMYGSGFENEAVCRFVPIGGQDADDEVIGALYALYSRRHVTARAREDFLWCLQSWGSTVYAVYYGGELEGYFDVSCDERSIFEFELRDASRLARAVYEFADEFGISELGITVGGDETEKIGTLDRMCDYFNVGMSRQIKILNYKSVLEFLMKWKSQYCRLGQGQYTIGISETKEKYLICVSGAQKIQVSATDNAPSISFGTGSELVYALTTPQYYQECQRPHSRLKDAPAGWFPLPFYLPEPDAF